MRYKVMTVFLFLFSLCQSVQAALVIDTGSPALTRSGGITLCNNGSWCQQSVALRVMFDSSVTIESIESWLYVSNQGDLTISLYNEIDGLPSSLVNSTILNVNSFNKGWYQTNQLLWNVAAGNYWAAFEVKSGQGFFGALEFPAPIQLTAAVLNNYYTTWTNIGTAGGGGLRVYGEVISAVPEPKTEVFFLLGIVSIFGVAAAHKRN